MPYLFFVGNKRSGTSLLVELLNFHPDVFVTPESDLVWILYQMRGGWPEAFQCYPWDGPAGMHRTLERAGTILKRAAHNGNGNGNGHHDSAGIPGLFVQVQEQLRLSASAEVAGKSPSWLGDKKPVQQSDPQLRPFLRQHFPQARYLHIVRDPAAVVASKLKAARQWKTVPDFWKDEPDRILERWAIHEEWVQQAKATEDPELLELRFEQLCRQPVEIMAEVFQFLDLDMPGEIADQIRRKVQVDPNRKYETFEVHPSECAKKMMQFYGY
jgi:sulfotransferase family protein